MSAYNNCVLSHMRNSVGSIINLQYHLWLYYNKLHFFYGTVGASVHPPSQPDQFWNGHGNKQYSINMINDY